MAYSGSSNQLGKQISRRGNVNNFTVGKLGGIDGKIGNDRKVCG